MDVLKEYAPEGMSDEVLKGISDKLDEEQQKLLQQLEER